MTIARILQITDLHLFHDPESRLAGIPTQRTLRSVIEQLRQESTIDQLVVTGDHTHDELPESYQTVRQLLTPWLDRLSVVPGNHDDRSVMRSVLGDVLDRQLQARPGCPDRINFRFQAGSWLCLGLDTHQPGEVSGDFGTSQADWLRQQLQQHGDAPSVLFCHHPPVDIPSPWMDPIGLLDRQHLIDVIEEHPSVRLVCCGHVHHESEHRIGTTRVVTTPSTGVQFDPHGEQPTFTSDPPGYRIIELSESDLQTRVVRLPQAEYTPITE